MRVTTYWCPAAERSAAVWLLLLLLLGPATEAAGEGKVRFTKEFKKELEPTAPKLRACGVLLENDVPASSIYGATRTFKRSRGGSWYSSPGELYYPVTLAGGKVEDAVPDKVGWRDVPRSAYLVEKLKRGDVLTLAGIDYKSTGLVLRILSLDDRRVVRGNDPKTGEPIIYREPYGVEFRIVPALDKSEWTGADVPAVMRYIGRALRLFPDCLQASTFSLSLKAGQRNKPPK